MDKIGQYWTTQHGQNWTQFRQKWLNGRTRKDINRSAKILARFARKFF